MRRISLLIAGAALASCTTAPPPPPTRTAQAEQELQQLLAGKVAQPPVSCISNYQANDMRVIDDDTVAFRQSSHLVYVAHMRGGCTGIDRPGYALVTRQVASAQLCSGDPASVIDTTNRMIIGGCVFGDFTPYSRP